MAVNKIPPASSVADEQFVQIAGPNGITTGYQYDAQQRAFYFKESQALFPSFHGPSHIAEDPIPSATCDSPGLMNSDDKCKLDAILSTRVGILGFQGAGFPDDGGWLQGDIILAAGTEFISIERIGNVVRFTVDSPIPLNCACEECAQIYWVQDETDIVAVRPPVCGGRLPGANVYGEMKIYLFPESAIVDPNDPSLALNNKDQYPAWIFKRYDDAIVPGAAEHEMILKRDGNNSTVTEIGWAMTPGALGVPEMVWFMGKNNDGGQIRFKLDAESDPGLLGSLLYNGHLITKKMGVITSYSPTVLGTNQYMVREWNVDTRRAIGGAFMATNVWRFRNPENPASGRNAQKLVLDSSIDLLPIGTLVDLWQFKVGEVSGEPIYRRYFSLKPSLNPNNMWVWAGNVQFGDTLTAREELTPDDGSADKISSVIVSAARNLESNVWGLTHSQPIYSYNDGNEMQIANDRAMVDQELPGLIVDASSDNTGNFSEQPVWLWNRRDFGNSITRIDLGMPDNNYFTPLDIVFRAKIDENTNKYMRVIGTGVINGKRYIKVDGIAFDDLPSMGDVRLISDTNGQIFHYVKKLLPQSVITPSSEASTSSYGVILLSNDDGGTDGGGTNGTDSTDGGTNGTDGGTNGTDGGTNGTDECELGITWVQRSIEANMPGFGQAAWSSVAFGNGMFLVISSGANESPGLLGSNNSNIAVISSDTINWTLVTMPGAGPNESGGEQTGSRIWEYITYGNGKFVALDRNGYVAVSTDGYSWIESELPNSTNLWGGITYGNDVFVAISSYANTGTPANIAATSQDGINWTERTLPTSGVWLSLTHGGGKFVAVAADSNKSIVSTDGVVWLQSTLPIPMNPLAGFGYACVTYGDNKFVATTWNSDIVSTSLDGIIWDEHKLPSVGSWTNVIYGNNLFFAKSINGPQTAISYDGIYWIESSFTSSSFSLSFRDIAYGNDTFLMVTDKAISYTSNCSPIPLSVSSQSLAPYSSPESFVTGDIIELLHQEYNSPVVRLELSFNPSTNLIEMQVKVGKLDMGSPYENDSENDVDDYVRGLESGYAVSAIYSQAGMFSGVGTQPAANPNGFVVYDGGQIAGGQLTEYWNRLEIMVRDDQVWVWWNQLLIPPSSTLSSNLPTPVTVKTPYFPIKVDPQDQYGKTGLRMWPGTKIRRMDIRTQLTIFSEFTYGQLEIS